VEPDATSTELASALAELVGASHLMAPEDLPAAADEAARRLGALGCRIHLVTRDQRALRPLLGRGRTDESASLEGTLAGRAFRHSEVMASTVDGARLWVPLLDGTERLGVCQVEVAEEADLERLRRPSLALAALLAELVISKGQYTDSFEKTRRAVPMGVPAELLWRQLPPTTFATDRFVITALLEPWHEVGGDAFDYSLDGDVLHVAVFDGMGHGLSAALLASVALAAYRNARRGGRTLLETAEVVDDVLEQEFGDDSFVTGVLGRLDLTTGPSRCCARRTPRRCWCATGGPSARSPSTPGHRWASASGRTGCWRSPSSPATGWCCSATAWSRPAPQRATSSAWSGCSTS
jgi:hypothetical protein